MFVEIIMGPGILKIEPWGLTSTGAPKYALASCHDFAGFQTQLRLHLQPVLNNLQLVHPYRETAREMDYLPSTDALGILSTSLLSYLSELLLLSPWQ